ncbi:MAG: ATP synthase F1 subunit delta [Firmicutes bacterium]|nr:ATP synthase F1 subunit delta [Bacillota bacterium]
METINETALVFGRAFAELAMERNELSAAVEDLEVARTAFALPEMEKFYTNPLVPRTAKLELLERIFGRSRSSVMLPFLKVVILRRRERLLRAILRAALYQCLTRLGTVVVTVTSATELDEEIKRRLTQRLEAYLGCPVYPEYRLNPRLLGGMVIRYKDRVLDASVLGLLQRMEDSLLTGLKGGEG